MEEDRIGIDGDEGDDGNGQRQSTTTTTTTTAGGGAGPKKLHVDREEAVKKQVILLKYFRKDGKKSRSYSRKRSSQTSSSKSEKEDDLPDGAAIDIYLDMWEGVFTFVPKMKAWSIFEANHWDVKKTMIELEKLDKQNKAEQNQQSEEQNSLLKTEVGENSEDQRMLGVTEEVEMFTMNSVEEKLKAEKESVTDNVRSTSPVLHESIRATSSAVLLSGCKPPKKSVVGGENCHTSMTTNNTLSLGTPPSHPAIVCVANPEMQEELEKNVKVEIVVKEENMMETVEEEPCESKENMMETEEEEPCESEKEFEEVGNSSGMSLRNVRLPRLSDSQDESLQKYLTKSSQKFPDKQSDKQARLMSSSNEENNDDDDDDDDDEGKDNWDSNTNKEQVNSDSHNNTSEDDDMPDGAAIDKYLEMWDMVYNFVSKMESLEIFRANHWDVRETMIELGKLDKQYKAQLKQRREDVEKTSKKKAAEKREKLRMLGLAEREQEMLPRQHMKERLKTHKESVKGTNFTTRLVAHNTGSDRHTTQPHQLPLRLKCSAQKALPLTQHQQDQLLSLIKDREVTLTCPAFDPKARCWEEITRLFNASHPHQHPRSPKQLKQCWKNIRRSTRNKALKAAYLQLRRTTDEGPPTNTPKYSQYLEMAIDLAMGEMAEEFGVTVQHTHTQL